MKEHMAEKLLHNANIAQAETMFLQQPDGVFAVWGDEIRADGSDERISELYHAVTVELYEPAEWQGREERDALIDALNEAYADGLIDPWRSEMRVWLADVRLFMTTFEFEYLERR